MKVLTIRQPWASLIVCGAKDIENRVWPTNYRGTICVHTSNRLVASDMADACRLMKGFIPKFSEQRFKQDEFPLGSIIGTVDIIGCVEQSDSPWFQGKYGFVLANAKAWKKPVPVRGALGLWEWTPTL